MSSKFTNMLSSIPSKINKIMKKKKKGEHNISTSDIPFKMSTSGSSILFLATTIICYLNEYFRNVDIDCNPIKYESHHYIIPKEHLNEKCWNIGTFLFTDALKEDNKDLVDYPGIWNYRFNRNPSEQERIYQIKYNHILIAMTIIGIISYIPMFLWKWNGFEEKLKPIIHIENDTEEGNIDEIDATRVQIFLKTIGNNDGTALCYFACKLLALILTVSIWIYLSFGLLGENYISYGGDVFNYWLKDIKFNWPRPMDLLFPKIGMCQLDKYIPDSHFETKTYLCNLPLNKFAQYIFLYLWWSLIVDFFLNAIHLIGFCSLFFRSVPESIYRDQVAEICSKLVGNSVTSMKHTKKILEKIVVANISYGDAFMLDFINNNLKSNEFNSFIRKLALTQNKTLHLELPEEINTDNCA